VQLARLPSATDGAFRAFVRFPAGWERPEAGHYACAEEVLVLEGDLGLNDMTWGAGGYAWIPAYRVRSALRSESGCLAFAWFGAPPRWIPGTPTNGAPSGAVSLAHWRDAPGGTLYWGAEHHTSIVARRDVGRFAAGAHEVETLDLHDFAWRLGALPEPAQAPAGEVLLRTWPARNSC
jgi:hypothetical protein